MVPTNLSPPGLFKEICENQCRRVSSVRETIQNLPIKFQNRLLKFLQSYNCPGFVTDNKPENLYRRRLETA